MQSPVSALYGYFIDNHEKALVLGLVLMAAHFSGVVLLNIYS